MRKFIIMSGLSAALLAGAFGFAEAQQTGTGAVRGINDDTLEISR